MQPIYLDHAATTPLAPEVREAMRPFLDSDFGNPSSRHPLGVRAAEAIERARGQVARALCVETRNVVFTGGGTEANNLAILGGARAAKQHGRHVIVGPTEHPCVRAATEALAREGFEVESARLTSDGSLDLDDLARRLRADTVLVAQMFANNELGTIYPIRRLAKLVRARAPKARVSIDAVQALGKLDCSLTELGVDCLSISAHKVHGPKGVGVLALASDLALEPLIFGGGQERGLRSGTENVAGIVGCGMALELAEARRVSAHAHMLRLRQLFTERVAELPGLRVLAQSDARLPSVVAVVVPGAPAEVHMHHLEARGVYVSAGSACHSIRREASPSLRALGLSEDDALHLLRISFARTTTEAEVESAARTMVAVARELEAVTR